MGSALTVGLGAVVAAAGRDALVEVADAARAMFREGGRGEVRAATDFDSVFVRNSVGNPAVGLFVDPATGNGYVTVGNASGVADPTGLKAFLGVTSTNSGRVVVANGSNTAVFQIDGNTGLQSGPADLAEAFSATTSGVEPGTVMVIDPGHAGRLAVSDRPYDRRVAGVVAGANAFPSAITLAGLAEKPNKVAVTLTGTVYARVSAENGAVRAGDLLTTAGRPGHAMRVTDIEAARGAILGKAMQDLEGETGMVLVLASLQ